MSQLRRYVMLNVSNTAQRVTISSREEAKRLREVEG
jgi:hypothetical protein